MPPPDMSDYDYNRGRKAIQNGSYSSEYDRANDLYQLEKEYNRQQYIKNHNQEMERQKEEARRNARSSSYSSYSSYTPQTVQRPSSGFTGYPPSYKPFNIFTDFDYKPTPKKEPYEDLSEEHRKIYFALEEPSKKEEKKFDNKEAIADSFFKSTAITWGIYFLMDRLPSEHAFLGALFTLGSWAYIYKSYCRYGAANKALEKASQTCPEIRPTGEENEQLIQNENNQLKTLITVSATISGFLLASYYNYITLEEALLYIGFIGGFSQLYANHYKRNAYRIRRKQVPDKVIYALNRDFLKSKD